MDQRTKQYADNRDLKSLKYLFVDSLDVDPTFEKFEEEYDYCKSIPGLLEPHRELTPLTENISQWTDVYWAKLKMDLIENFSDKRMTHMREVAKVLLKDKIERLQRERTANARTPHQPSVSSSVTRQPQSSSPQSKPKGLSKNEQVRQNVEEDKRKLAEEEKKKEKEIARAKEEAQRRSQQITHQTPHRQRPQETGAKKALGVVAVLLAVIIILLVMLLHNPSKEEAMVPQTNTMQCSLQRVELHQQQIRDNLTQLNE